MKLFYNPTKNPMAKSTVFRMAKVTLRAGLNELTEAQETAIKAHPDYSKFIELGVFVDSDEIPETVKRTTKKKPVSPIMLDLPQ